MVRMTADALDLAAARLEELGAEQERLRAELREQVEEFGFTPPRADKSRRLAGTFYQFTLTVGLTTEVKDAEVERIRAVCPDGLFKRLFKTVTKYKLADGATLALADRLPEGAPRNLRMLFSKAVETKQTAPRLRVEKMADECVTSYGSSETNLKTAASPPYWASPTIETWEMGPEGQRERVWNNGLLAPR